MDEDLRQKINGHYQRGEGSIQDIARVYHVSVDDVLRVIGAPHLGSVTAQGDLIDGNEAGPNVQMNYGKDFKVPFTVD